MVMTSPTLIHAEKIKIVDLPVIDLSADRPLITKLIVEACEEYGFFKVINHGIPQHIIDKMERESFSFFAKPAAEKHLAGPPNPFGYGCKNIGFNGDMGEVEYLLLGASTSDHSLFLAQKTTISKDAACFRSAVTAYIEAVNELACGILDMMAEGLLGVPGSSVFSKLIRDVGNDSVLRLNHYPSIPLVSNDCKDRDTSPSYNHSRVGFGEHSDPQILTILRSNDVPGLQISLQDGVWIPVSPDPSAFYVNVGDALQVTTNGRFVSVRHRAVTNSCKSRLSMAYFGAPPLQALITAPPEMSSPQRPPLYRPFTWGEYKKTTYSLRLGDDRLSHFRRTSDGNLPETADNQ